MDNNWKYSEEIRAGLEKFKADNNYTTARLAALMLPQFDKTRVSKYLNLDPTKTPEPDMSNVEDAARRLLRHHKRHADFRQNLFKTRVSEQIELVIKMISNAGQIGVVYGPAGAGKTCGAHLFARERVSAIVITATRYARNTYDVARMIFDEINDPVGGQTEETKADMWDGKRRRTLFIEERLKARERQIIVDMAHRMNLGAFEYLCDLHDATNTPICWIGTAELLDVLRKDPQIWSRVGIIQEVGGASDDKPDTTSDADVASRLIRRICDDPDAEHTLLDKAIDVLSKDGHARALRMRLTLARVIRDQKRSRCWEECWADAGVKLIKSTKKNNRQGNQEIE